MIEFYIGLGLAVSSSLFIGSSFIIKKKALLKLATYGQRAGAGGHGYLRDWLWWSGTITMGLGEACNFIAYALAPASLVTPLGALSVLVSTVLASKFLHEKLNLLGKLGCALCLCGSTMIVIHAPKEENIESMVQLGQKVQSPGFIIYVVALLFVTLFLAVQVAPKHGNTNILVYIGICSLIGSLSVLGCKGFGLAVKETLAGYNQFGNILTYFWFLSIVVCVSVQLNYLNKALDVFNTALVTPIYYVMFTTCVITSSGILYNEWKNLPFADVLGNLIGFIVTVLGIFQLTIFKEINVTWKQLMAMTRKQQQNNISSSPHPNPYAHLDDRHSIDTSMTMTNCEANTRNTSYEPNGLHFQTESARLLADYEA